MSEFKKPYIEYNSPKDNIERDETPQHSLELIVDGKVIGAAELTYQSKPFPFYHLNDLYIDFEEQGQGYGSLIMDKVEEFLLKRKKAGMLSDAINLDSPARGMYERRGWQAVPGEITIYAFNIPKSTNINQLTKYYSRQTHLLDREGYQAKLDSGEMVEL